MKVRRAFSASSRQRSVKLWVNEHTGSVYSRASTQQTVGKDELFLWLLSALWPGSDFGISVSCLRKWMPSAFHSLVLRLPWTSCSRLLCQHEHQCHMGPLATVKVKIGFHSSKGCLSIWSPNFHIQCTFFLNSSIFPMATVASNKNPECIYFHFSLVLNISQLWVQRGALFSWSWCAVGQVVHCTKMLCRDKRGLKSNLHSICQAVICGLHRSRGGTFT